MARKKSNKPKDPNTRYGLSVQHSTRAARQFMDWDYLDKLSPEELDFLEQFSREYYQCHPGKFYETKEQKRDCYSVNNQRNRDIWLHQTRVDLEEIEENGDITEDTES